MRQTTRFLRGLWSARCLVTGTPGAGGGSEKPTGGNTGRALRVDLTMRVNLQIGGRVMPDV